MLTNASRSDRFIGGKAAGEDAGASMSTGAIPRGRAPRLAAAVLVVALALAWTSRSLFDRLPGIIVGVGVLLAFAAAAMTDRLARRRHQAERVAGSLNRVAAENRELYTEQRSIAQSLQHALLPEALPGIPGMDVSARYVPAASGIEVGGDWYDVVVAEDRRVMLVIGSRSPAPVTHRHW
jgi:MFS superfamily sulfate permease-like transporter